MFSLFRLDFNTLYRWTLNQKKKNIHFLIVRRSHTCRAVKCAVYLIILSSHMTRQRIARTHILSRTNVINQFAIYKCFIDMYLLIATMGDNKKKPKWCKIKHCVCFHLNLQNRRSYSVSLTRALSSLLRIWNKKIQWNKVSRKFCADFSLAKLAHPNIYSI